MTEIDSLLAMGQHGAFIWPAYGLTAVVMIGFAVSSLRRLRKEQRRLAQLLADVPDRRSRSGEAAR